MVPAVFVQCVSDGNCGVTITVEVLVMVGELVAVTVFIQCGGNGNWSNCGATCNGECSACDGDGILNILLSNAKVANHSTLESKLIEYER